VSSGLASRHDSPLFPGFAAADLAFLTGLAAHNDREWFTANRAVYDERLKPTLAALIDALNGAFAARDLPLAGDPKKSVFRIHRDVRFSKDKRPYKTHVSATLTRDGQKLSPGLVYVHIEPEGGPAPAFDPETIDPLDPSTLPSAQAADDGLCRERPVRGGGVLSVGAPAHRRLPPGHRGRSQGLGGGREGPGQGAAAGAGRTDQAHAQGLRGAGDGPLEPALKRTRWLVRRPLTGAEIGGDELPQIIADFVADARPLLAFGWKALG
jgi:uncharacterized protein (DUF2461 family)